MGRRARLIGPFDPMFCLPVTHSSPGGLSLGLPGKPRTLEAKGRDQAWGSGPGGGGPVTPGEG